MVHGKAWDLEKNKGYNETILCARVFSTIMVSLVDTIGRVYVIKTFKEKLQYVNTPPWSNLKLEWTALEFLQ